MAGPLTEESCPVETSQAWALPNRRRSMIWGRIDSTDGEANDLAPPMTTSRP